MKLNRRKLRKLIIQEIESIEEDALRKMHDDPGRQRIQMQKSGSRSCQECGANMYEGESSCMECGAMYSKTLNEGDCGCNTCADCGSADGGDYSLDTMAVDNLLSMFDLQPSHHEDHNNNYMAKPSLYKVAKYAQKLLQMIPDGHELDDWQRTKIAQISDDISEVYHSLDYRHAKGKL